MPGAVWAPSRFDAMAKRNHRRGGRTTPRGTRPQGTAPGRRGHDGGLDHGFDPGTGQLVRQVRAYLKESSPYGLLSLASELVETTTTRPTDTWPGVEVDRLDGPSTLVTLAETDVPELVAVAIAAAAIHPDPELAAQIRQAVPPTAVTSGPSWLGTIGDIEITGTWWQTEVLGDVDNLMVGWRWPAGAEAMAVVYVDHNQGTIVKDAFIVPESATTVLAKLATLPTPPAVPLDPAGSRARIEAAIERVEHRVPPVSTDTWPADRPLIEWVVRHLPPDGVGYVRPEWPEPERERLLDEFLSSPEGEVDGVDTDIVRKVAESLMTFACDYGPGDPLRWSPISVEMVLADWFPRKVHLPDEEMATMPAVLEGFVRHAHARKEISADDTERTLASLDEWTPDYLDAISEHEEGPEAHALRLARVAAGVDPDAFDGADLDGADLDLDGSDLDGADLDLLLRVIEAQSIALVGGLEAYEALTDEPLGDVPFDWSRVAPDLVGPTTLVLEHLDRLALERFDAEVRTIARVILATVVAEKPDLLGCDDRHLELAASILAFYVEWVAMPPEVIPDVGWSGYTQEDLAEAAGAKASTIGNRAKTIADIVDPANVDWSHLLHSRHRRAIIDAREAQAERQPPED